MASSVERARAAFARQEWGEAFAAYAATGDGPALAVDDQERLAVCAYLLGRDDECAEAWEAAHRLALTEGDVVEAGRCAFWLGMCLLIRGHMAQAGGWLARAAGLVSGLDCPAAGYLRIPELLTALYGGDPATARDLAVEATEVGHRFDDADLCAFGTLGHGQALIALGHVGAGTAKLDEVMVSVIAGEVGPITSGIVYCAVILECMQLFDLRRAAEWTDALSAWCDVQPDLVPYRGQCLVHRSQLKQAAGDWRTAMEAADAACRRLVDPPHPALGLAYYQQAELHRLVGHLDHAEESYRQASRHGYEPMPGLALLKLAQGAGEAASAAVGRALQEAGGPYQRAALLFAAAEILQAIGDLPGARSAADELTTIAATSPAGVIAAMAAQARGTVLLDEGDAVTAMAELRGAASAWRSLRMPYDEARSRVSVGLACAAMGDHTSAAMEFDHARDMFTELGADPDLARLRGLTAPVEERAPSTLSAREREVLAYVAAGRTNREIATALVISQHTVGRHLENIFTKLGVTNRAAATAYAYEHDLL